MHTYIHAYVHTCRVITGENWQSVMRDVAVEYPYCTTQAEAAAATGDVDIISDCGSKIGAIVFFDAFYLIGNNVLLNLFIAGMSIGTHAYARSEHTPACIHIQYIHIHAKLHAYVYMYACMSIFAGGCLSGSQCRYTICDAYMLVFSSLVEPLYGTILRMSLQAQGWCLA
jgi:hypothetical protein